MPLIKTPITEPKPFIDEATAVLLLSDVMVESQVIIHCAYTGSMWEDSIRIWKSTFLFANDSEHVSGLVSAENITLFPEWTVVKPGETVNFTLVFTGLPKDCESFDLVEQIPQDGGFEFQNIVRNKRDVYFIDLTGF